MYITRYIEKTILEITKSFKVLYLGGPRQVGKTTVLKHLAEKQQRNYVTLDNLNDRNLAKKDPELFLQKYPAPLFIDEVQYAPDLFSYIKIRVDQSQINGSYWLTGSQQFRVMKNVHESLAGRVGIIQLLGLSNAEIDRKPFLSQPFLPSSQPLSPQFLTSLGSINPIFNKILTGFFPYFWRNNVTDRTTFYNSYLQSYIERDLQAIFGLTKLAEFQTFIRLCAARSGQLLNYSELAKDSDISVHAAKEWLSILQSTMQVYLLRPYYRNFSKRLIKAPKLYFLDTGLATHLTKWPDAQTLQAGAMAGSFFETYVISEIIKSYLFRGLEPPLSYFRDKEGHEVDLLIESGQKVYPVEVKLASRVQTKDIPSMFYLQKKLPNCADGGVICLSPQRYPITRGIDAIPVEEIQ
ncbi:MAG: ATP-binding protein [Patescibacteria group bacterium]|jgi:hypothetical protein